MKWLRIVALLLASLWGPVAFGHGGSHATSPDGLPTVMTKLPKGVSLQVVETNALQFTLATNGCCEVEVLDEQGEPFIKIGKGGVQANLAEPAWHRAQMPGGGKVPEQVVAGMPAMWKAVSNHPGFGWYDKRLNEGGPETFTLQLRVDGVVKQVAVERIPPEPKGMWRAKITQEPSWDAVYSIMSGTGGEAMVLGLLPQASGELVVLDERKEPFLKLTKEGGAVNTKHPWYPKLQLKTQGEVNNGWVALAGGGKAVMANPALIGAQERETHEARLWLQYGGETKPLVIRREWVSFKPEGAAK